MSQHIKKDTIRTTVELQLADLRKKLSHKNIHIDYDASVFDFLTDASYTSKYGTRAVEHVIKQHVTDALTDKLDSGELSSEEPIFIYCTNGSLAFRNQHDEYSATPCKMSPK